tara:strand:- start:4 stop:1722 length:1719 start_codon:yes stop_codon:yes gene_type:complete
MATNADDFFAVQFMFDGLVTEAAALLAEEEEEEPEVSKSQFGLRRNKYGEWERSGGWEPEKRQQPDEEGQAGWRHKWWNSRLWHLLQDDRTKDSESYEGKRFRSLLGVPRQLFEELYSESKQWRTTSDNDIGNGVRGPTTVPANLKLAAFLVWLRSKASWRFAAFFAGHMDDNTLRRWAVKFVHLQVEHEYPKHVYWLDGDEHTEECNAVLALHSKLGMPGCIAGSDGCEFDLASVPDAELNDHTGGKSTGRSRQMLFHSDARGIYHHVHGSHVGKTNDKTMARMCRYMQAIKERRIYKDVQFHLLVDASGNTKTWKHPWLMTDNGFHAWRICQYPTKHWCDKWVGYWSARAESFRKPQTECNYGTLKQRWRQLDAKILIDCRENKWHESVRFFDNLVRFACMLQNRLLRYDKLDTVGSQPSHWISTKSIPVDPGRFYAGAAASEDGLQIPANATQFFVDPGEAAEEACEHEPSHDQLYGALVDHFHYAWGRGEVFWRKTALSLGLGVHGMRRKNAKPRSAGRRKLARRGLTPQTRRARDENEFVFADEEDGYNSHEEDEEEMEEADEDLDD